VDTSAVGAEGRIFSVRQRQHIAYRPMLIARCMLSSVRLSITRVYHTKTIEVRIMKFSPSTLVFVR